MDLPKKKIVDNYINYYLFATMFKIQFYVYCMLLLLFLENVLKTR